MASVESTEKLRDAVLELQRPVEEQLLSLLSVVRMCDVAAGDREDAPEWVGWFFARVWDLDRAVHAYMDAVWAERQAKGHAKRESSAEGYPRHLQSQLASSGVANPPAVAPSPTVDRGQIQRSGKPGYSRSKKQVGHETE